MIIVTGTSYCDLFALDISLCISIPNMSEISDSVVLNTLTNIPYHINNHDIAKNIKAVVNYLVFSLTFQMTEEMRSQARKRVMEGVVSLERPKKR